MRLDPIHVVDHVDEWTTMFGREQVRLERVFAPVLARKIEHIGSTSIPGLAAKPIIDMLAVVTSIERASRLVPAAGALGWLAAPEPEDMAERRGSLCFPSVERRTHHLHLVEERSTRWHGWLAFRDYLRTHPDLAAEYAALKRELAARYGADPNDRTKYREGKSAFVRRVTSLAVGGDGTVSDVAEA